MWVIIIIAPIFWNSNASGLLIFKVRPAEAKEVAKEEELAKLADQNQSNPFSQNLFWFCSNIKNIIQTTVLESITGLIVTKFASISICHKI